jgi:uncharacterized membrane protein YbjE (DUF340 family)
MSTAVSLLLLLAFLFAGYSFARFGWLRFTDLTGRVFTIALYLLLFSMGLRLGQSRDVLSSLPLVGLLAVSGALFASAGTVIMQLLFAPVYRRLDRLSFARMEGDLAQHAGAKSVAANPSLAGSRRLSLFFYNFKKPLILLALVIAGTGVGLMLPDIAVIRDGSAATWILNFLLFLIGIQMNSGENDLSRLFSRPSLLVLPLVTIAGTLLGSLGTLMFDGMTPGRALALGSGFGWYSLSGVLIANLGDPTLGAAAFLSNLFRETLAFLAVPLLRSTGRCESGIGIAGATSMDVTLPVIEDVWGPAVLPLSIAHGVILSLLVPFLVPLFMSL